MKRFISIIISILLLSTAFSQDISSGGSSGEAAGAGEDGSPSLKDYYDVGGKSEYFFGSKGSGALMIKVNLWGKVKRPGLYEIPIKTDLVTLLSFAGGPSDDARLDNIRIIRHIQATTEVLNIDVKKYLNNGDMSIIPNLMPGDTILISGSTLHLLALTVKVLGQVMTAVNFYFFMSNIVGN